MILTYHKVYPEAKTIWWVTPDSFYRQMADLRSKKVVYLDDYDPADETQAVITFDGAYKDICKYAVPILQHFGYPFELFVIGQTIGKDNSFDTVEPRAEFADLETLQKMVKAGGRLQWHSWSHARLAGATDLAVYEKELSIPNELRQLCPEGFKWYAYPHGERDEIYRAQVESRFAGALACDDGNDADRYDLNRLTVYEDTRLSKSTVSLIIPCYNYGHLAAEAIESALLQTSPPDEILFIDDASSDNSLEVARRYEPRIRVEANEKNLGVVENFRKAVELTSCDYVVFLGADNRFRSDYVEQCKAILDANSDVGVVYTHFSLFGDRAAIEAARIGAASHPVAPGVFVQQFPANPQKNIREQNYIHGSSMYRRAAYEQAGGYRKDTMPEDHSIFARILDQGWKARLWDAASLEYRQHSKDQINHLKTYEMENAYLRSNFMPLQRENARLTDAYASLAAEHARVKEEYAALSAELQAIYYSKGWRMLLLIRKMYQVLFPPASQREKVIVALLSPAVRLLRFMRNRSTYTNKKLLQSSNLFNASWYLEQNPDVAHTGVDPVEHYLLYGGFEGRNPSRTFSSHAYLSAHPDVRQAGINPLVHYLRFGEREGWHITAENTNIGDSHDTKKEETQTNTMQLQYGKNTIRFILEKYGGLQGIIAKIRLVVRQNGILFLFQRIRYVLRNAKSQVLTFTGASSGVMRQFRVVPFFLNPYQALPENFPSNFRIAVHLHLFYADMLEDCVRYLKNIPFPFSLYVSIPETENAQVITEQFQEQLSFVETVFVQKSPNRGRDIAPFVIDFGKELLKYDFIAHIHTKKSPHNRELDGWFDEIMETLLGSQVVVWQIIQLLQKDGKFVYPAPNQKILMDISGWSNNYDLAYSLAKKHLKENIGGYPAIEFPQGSMFWATSAALQKFLNISLKYTDFPAEPIPPDGTLAHALERLLLISANKLPGRNYCLYTPTSVTRDPAYEEQNDYASTIVHPAVKVLAYYLPQFYPTPENDLWHGKGFTEWNKVRSATPLFESHYQQRVPHEYVGYYSLTITDTLKKQAMMMKQAGAYGLVFYHYWFSGKLILEKPTQMLLEDPSIDIPFCFCWANENWTRKWDGNESEILLQQTYSAEDAAAFINYLIPFFKDTRYITIENRPVLFIYRPSSIPDFSSYQRIWKEACAGHGLPEPYVVAVLTRGAIAPNDFKMDAGCERVLHDWTAGAVKDAKNTLYRYWDVNGSVLDYNDVANYYMGQPAPKDFTYFHSIIPSWDNTPRYASDAYIVHNSTPQKFQQWMEHLIKDAEERLPLDRRFVLVNAWNEWAESATLDPDKRFGYAYLNSVGRSLSGIPYDDREYIRQKISRDINIVITLDESAIEFLQRNKEQKRKMFTSLAHSSLFSKCRITFAQPQVLTWFQSFEPGNSSGAVLPDDQPNYTLRINRPCYLTSCSLENMLKMALWYDAGYVIPTAINDENFTHANLLARWEVSELESAWPVLMLVKNGANRSVKCCVDARIFITNLEPAPSASPNVVTTIIRFHKSGSITVLENALYSLLAQVDCDVQPIIAVQDLTAEMLTELSTMLSTIPFKAECTVKIKEYYSDDSCPDLRSLMLNQELRLANTRYVAFLDYDDILFPHAYHWLLGRLKKTGKNASFGLIYTTISNLSEQKIKQRTVVYDYGKSFSDFFYGNHTPIHGFMLDISKIRVQEIEFFKCMKYNEDYYLTLQVFTEKDTDWESLHHRQFIGDYYHYEDNTQTLANLSHERNQLIKSGEYIDSELKIDLLKNKIAAKKKNSAAT